jgi:hypothetical protein
MIDESDVQAVANAARAIPPAEGTYIDPDFLLNLQETVLDYQMNTKAVVRALEHSNQNRATEIRTIKELEDTFNRFPADKDGNFALAQHLWGYKLWTRAAQLRLTKFFVGVGVTDQESLKDLAAKSDFKRDFEIG